jgi:hypothetical protein
MPPGDMGMEGRNAPPMPALMIRCLVCGASRGATDEEVSRHRRGKTAAWCGRVVEHARRQHEGAAEMTVVEPPSADI